MRTVESYHQHIQKTVSKCGSSWLVLSRENLLGPEYLVTPHQCKSNYCPECRQKNLHDTRKMLYKTLAAERWRLVTLTFPDHTKTPLEILCEIRKAFNNFTHRLRRRYPDVKFIRAIEVHQSGIPHIHLVINKYIPMGFLSKSWHECGGGFTDIRANRKCSVCGGALPCREHPGNHKFNFKQAARYLTEEFEKKFQDPHRLGVIFWQAGVKSITASRNLKLKASETDWAFLTAAKTVEDAMYYYEYLKFKNKFDGSPAPTVRSFDHDKAVIIGYGFSQKGGD